MTVWSLELNEAAANLASPRMWRDGGAVHATRESLRLDVMARAREILQSPPVVGKELSPMQESFMSALYSRTTDYDLAQHPNAKAFNAAFRAS